MDLAVAWVWFPLVLALVSLGAGLLVERTAGRRLPTALVVSVGFAAALVLSRLAVSLPVTATLTLPLLLAVALAGYVVGWPRLRATRPDPFALLAVLGVALVYGGPVMASGEPTFAGFAQLPDTSHQLTLASFLPEHGTDWESLPESSYKLELQKYLASAYPIAPQAMVGALAPLGSLEVAWLYQPFLTFVAAVLAASMYGLIAPWISSRPLRALVVFTAAQPALAVSYALQGSIKELTTCAALVLVAALAARTLHERWPARALVPLAVAAAAALGSLGPAAAAYLAALLVVPAAVWLWRSTRSPVRREFVHAAAVMVLGAVLILPILTSVQTAYAVNTATLDKAQDLGNLAAPLHETQASGVWLNGDYRYEPSSKRWLNWAAQGFVLGAAVLGLVWAFRRRAAGPLLLAVSLLAISAYLLRRGSPYADAKVLMVLSPGVLLLAALAPLALGRFARGIPAALVGLGVLGAVLTSNALAYHDVQLAPYERYEELLDINERLADEGPAILTEYDEFGEYMVRDARPYVQPEWPHGYRTDALTDPELRPSIKTPLDLDHLTSDYIQSVPAIVLRRSPTVSRPPSNYRLTHAGRWYEVWQRRPGTRGSVLAHLPAGDDVFTPAERPDCDAVRRLGRRAAREGGRLAYVPRPRLPMVKPLDELVPVGWYQYGAYPDSVVPIGPGTIVAELRVPAGGRYTLWLDGSFGRGFEVLVDGERVGDVRYHQGNPGQYLDVGTATLQPGVHEVQLIRGGGDLRPGNGGSDSSLRYVGPLVFSPVANERREVRWAEPEDATELCERSVDWIELVSPEGSSS